MNELSKNTFSSRSSLLLMEIILSILFFSLAGTVCLQMFVKAKLLEQDTAELDMAVRYVSSAAEFLNQPERTAESVAILYPAASVEGNTAFVWFKKDFSSCSQKEACYRLEIRVLQEDTHTAVWSAVLYTESPAEEIYRLEGTVYQPYTPQDRH